MRMVTKIGAMNDEYFVQNIGSTLHTYQSVDLELYLQTVREISL